MNNESASEQEVSLMEYCGQLLFRLICVRPKAESSEDLERYFLWRLSQAEIFFSRFGGMTDIQGKSILDFGCGLGSTSIFLAQHGARRVVGVDIDKQSVDFARNKVKSEFGILSDKIEFYLPAELKRQRFDLVVSEDCFEHYSDPLAVMKTIRGFLAEGGKVLIGFSPLWKSPSGGHISHMTKVPWAHLLFPERIIMRERKRYRPDENARTFAEMRGGLNKMTYSKFFVTMRDSGFRIEYLVTNASNSKLKPIVNLVRRLPLCFEYFTKNLYAVVTPEPNSTKLCANLKEQAERRNQMGASEGAGSKRSCSGKLSGANYSRLTKLLDPQMGRRGPTGNTLTFH